MVYINNHSSLKRPTVKSYFSGAGGMDLGLYLAGLQIVQSLEIDSTACKTLRANINGILIKEMRIEDITVKSQQPSDVIVGTYPCTKYSTISEYRTGPNTDLN